MEPITPEYEENNNINIKKKTELRLNDNLLRIEIENDEVTFTLFIGIPLYKYTKKYKYNEIKNELNKFNCKDIEKLYEYLISTEYKIISEEEIKKIKINNKEIELNEKILTNEETIEILLNEIYYFKEKINNNMVK